MEAKAGGYISKIRFNNGKELELRKNDIVLFVGPNNAGKSQALKDIYNLSSTKQPSIVVSEVTVTKYESPVLPLLERISTRTSQGSFSNYNVLGNSISITTNSESNFMRSSSFREFRNLFVANLNTSARLTICTPPSNITRNAAKSHPIHYAAYNSEYRKWLSNNYRKAFQDEIIPNTQFGAQLPLCIGKAVKFTEEFEDEQTRQEAYAEILDTYKQVQEQGDGIKSFTGILLYLMLDYYCIYLIDEPESFLHPPQAKIMGQIIGQTLTDTQQAFISTHSEDIIKGLLETCPERIKIVRITRKDNTNFFSVLENENFNEVWNDPLLKYSNIMSSLFHKSVVLCESDSDCKMYSIIENHIKQSAGSYSETLFIHCNGKHRMAKIAAALRLLNVDVKLIPDLDVMNDENVFKTIVEAFGVEWDAIKSDYNTVVSNLHSPKEKIDRKTSKTTILQVLDGSKNTNLSEEEVKNIQEAVRTISKWKNIKEMGISAIPRGTATTSFKKINQTLREKGIFLVPVGELECFIKEVGKHGPDWVNHVLEQYPNLDDEVYSEITQFIHDMNL